MTKTILGLQQENFNPLDYISPSNIPKGRVPDFESEFTPSPSPTKTFKSFFLGIDQNTQDKRDLFQNEEIVVYDSDTNEN